MKQQQQQKKNSSIFMFDKDPLFTTSDKAH